MNRRSFQQLLDGLANQLSPLSHEQFRQLSARLVTPAQTLEGTSTSVTAQASQCAHIIETARQPHLRCPRCEGTRFYRHGHANGLQRFQCRACKRTFNSLTGTPLARLRQKHRWMTYCDTLRDPGTTVRRAAEQVEVHRTTAFRWRHRMLARVKQDQQTPLQGIVEVAVMVVPESHKGHRTLQRPAHTPYGKGRPHGSSADQVGVLVARDREGRTHDVVTGKGPFTTAPLVTHLAPALGRHVLLVTDSHPAYRRFTRQHHITHHTIKACSGADGRGAIHTQNVDGYCSRLRAWLQHFRGVATRYLDNYCGWRRAIDAPRINSSEEFLRAAVGVFRI